MDLIQLQNAYNPDEFIQNYIRDVPPINVKDVGTDHISSLFTGLGELFLSIFSLIKHCEADFKERIQYTSLDRSYSRLILWHDTYQSMCSALHGDVPTNLADSVVGHLKDVGITLTDRFIPLISKDFADLQVERLEKNVIVLRSRIEMVNSGDDDDSDSSSNFDYDSYTEIAEDLKTDTTCLIGLNSLMNHPSLEPPVVGAVSGDAVEQWELHQPYCDRISNRFPDGIESLISRLGKANYGRYIQWIQRHSEVDDDGIDETEARQKANTVVVSAFHDSGLGSSVPSKSSYAETVMSYGADGNRQSVRVPPLSKEAKQGLPFTCVACYKTVTIKNNSLWKRHLYEDLCPWMCLDPECPSGDSVFSQRNDWLAHLSFEHRMAPDWASFECPLCRSDIEPGKISITRHLGGHLEEIALGSLPIQTEWDNENDEDSQTSASDEASREDSPGKVNPIDPTVTMIPNEEPPLPPVSKESGTSQENPEASEYCEICGFRPKGDPRWFKGTLSKHKKLQHSLERPKMYRCRYPGCATVCTRKDNRRRHEREKHRFVKSESAENITTDNIFDSVDDPQPRRKSKRDGSHKMFQLAEDSDETNEDMMRSRDFALPQVKNDTDKIFTEPGLSYSRGSVPPKSEKMRGNIAAGLDIAADATGLRDSGGKGPDDKHVRAESPRQRDSGGVEESRSAKDMESTATLPVPIRSRYKSPSVHDLDDERARKRRSGTYINGERISVNRSGSRRERPSVTFAEPSYAPPSRRSGTYINGERISMDRSEAGREGRSSTHVAFVEPSAPPPSPPNYNSPLYEQPVRTSTTYHDGSYYSRPRVRLEVNRPRRNGTYHTPRTYSGNISSEAKRLDEEVEKGAEAERKSRKQAELEGNSEDEIKRLIAALDSRAPIPQIRPVQRYRRDPVSIRPRASAYPTNSYLYQPSSSGRRERRRSNEEEEQQDRLRARMIPQRPRRGSATDNDRPTVVYHDRDRYR